MTKQQIFYEWEDQKITQRFRTGVSLHGHTFHSKECLSFISRVTKNVPYLSPAIRRQEDKYRLVHGRDLDLRRAWWTPPLSPSQAVELEAKQIEERGLSALVSLSDHDDMNAGNSVEWTGSVPENVFPHRHPQRTTGVGFGVDGHHACVYSKPF